MNNQEFVNQTSYPELAQAVINQIGGWEEFKWNAPNVASYGADGGFNGFIYYSETCELYRRNHHSILRAFQNECEEIGESTAECLARFNCIDATNGEAEQFLLGIHGGDYTQFENGLTWWALERVCSDYVAFKEMED